MKKNIKYSVFVFFVLVMCLSLGIYLGFRSTKNNKNLEDYTETADDENSEDETQNVTPVSTKKYDIELVYQDVYKTCGHVIENKKVVYSTTLDELKEQEEKKQTESGNKYAIEEESNERLVYKREISQYCPNHFLIKIEEGTVVIYNIIDDSAMSVYKKIEVDSNSLNPEMLEELNTGIKVDSKEKLNLLIEDIES